MKHFLSVVFALALALAVTTSTPSSASAETGGRFILLDHNKKIVTDLDFQGKYLLMLFGYTFCPDICPTGMQELAEVMELLGPDAKKVQPLFISVDPERDTPRVLREYVNAFDERIIGLTGSKASIDSITKKYRVKFARVEDKPGDPDYTMDHTASVILMDKQGKYIRRFGYGTPAAQIVKALKEAFMAEGTQSIFK